jgi:hypothetical protein
MSNYKKITHLREVGVNSWYQLYQQIKGFKGHKIFRFSKFSENQIEDCEIDAETLYLNIINEFSEIGIDKDDLWLMRNSLLLSDSIKYDPVYRQIIEKLRTISNIL